MTFVKISVVMLWYYGIVGLAVVCFGNKELLNEETGALNRYFLKQ